MEDESGRQETIRTTPGFHKFRRHMCRPVRSDAAAAGHRGFRWVAAAELAGLQFPPANKAIVEKLAHGDLGGTW